MLRMFVEAEMQKGHTGVRPCDYAICNRFFNGECRCVALLDGLQVGTFICDITAPRLTLILDLAVMCISMA
jgi:hypothetical protein